MDKARNKRMRAVAVEEEVKKKKNKPLDINIEAETVTEEEVDEFFTVLRRMHVAVKYFRNESKGKEAVDNDLGSRSRTEKGRKALETKQLLEGGVDSSVDGIKEVKMMMLSDDERRHRVVVDVDEEETCCRLLDLNAIPEPDEE